MFEIDKRYIEMHELIKKVADQQGIRIEDATRLTNRLACSNIYLDDLRSIDDVSNIKMIGDARARKRVYYPNKQQTTYKLLVAVKEYLSNQ